MGRWVHVHRVGDILFVSGVLDVFLIEVMA